jgi:YaiO family outer membrane protein
LYANLPKGFEADAGFRYLNFDNDTWIYTGAIGKYYKSYWFNLRAYVTPDDDRISQSYSLTTRYYTGGSNDYISISIGSGISPDDRSQTAQLNSNYKLQTKKASAAYHFSIKKMNLFYIGVNYANIEYQPKTKDNQVTASIGYQRRF